MDSDKPGSLETSGHGDGHVPRLGAEGCLGRLVSGDFWGGPDIDWVLPDARRGDEQEEGERKADARSCYRVGTKALQRGELDDARAFLAVAVDEHHPGAAFRTAVTELRAFRQQATAVPRQAVLDALAQAARFGHGDARRLMEYLAAHQVTPCTAWAPAEEGAGRQVPGGGATPAIEDSQFYEELRRYAEALVAHATAGMPSAAPGAPSAPSARVDDPNETA